MTKTSIMISALVGLSSVIVCTADPLPAPAAAPVVCAKQAPEPPGTKNTLTTNVEVYAKANHGTNILTTVTNKWNVAHETY